MKPIFQLTFALLLTSATAAFCQDSTTRILKVSELFSLAEQNSKTLEISRKSIAISRQQTEIAKSARLPEVGASITAGYIGNIAILDPNFNYTETVPVPHFTNNYGLEANQMLYNGNRLNNTIAKAKLEETLSELSYDQDKETIKMLLIGRYLELYRLFNQQKVYEKNIELARARLKNIEGMHTEGMVTRNDIIRSELQLTDLEVLLDQTANNIAIINKELTVVLGLPEHTQLAVDTTLAYDNLQVGSFEDNLRQAYNQRPSIKATQVHEAIASKNISMAKAEQLPVLSLFAEEGLSRPYLYILPPQDIYYNIYQAGIKLHYNITSLYHAKEHIHLATLQQEREHARSEQVNQQAILDVNAAYIKYNEAKTELERREKARLLAEDNYRIVEKKYLNQLALLTDILDASSAKLASELNQSNAGINILFQWYQLQQANGTL